MISKFFSLFGIFKPLAYIYIFLTSVMQFVAMADFLVNEWDWHWLIAAPISFILAGIPWLSAILGVICSYFAWDLDLWQSVILIAGPHLVLVAILIVMGILKILDYFSNKPSQYSSQQSSNEDIIDNNSIWEQIRKDGTDITNRANILYEHYCKNEPLLSKLTNTAAQDYFGSDIAIPKAIVNVTSSLIDTCNSFEQLQPEIETILYKIESLSKTHKPTADINTLNKTLKGLIQACSVMPTRKDELNQILDAAHHQIEIIDLCTLKFTTIKLDKDHDK